MIRVEVANRHLGVRREREARKRGPRHRFWPSAAAAAAADGCGGLRFRVGGVTKIEDRCPKTAIPRGRGRKSGRSDAAKRPFRVGGVTKVGDPTPQNRHSAWEGSQKSKIGAPKRPFREGIYLQPPDRPPLAAVTL